MMLFLRLYSRLQHWDTHSMPDPHISIRAETFSDYHAIANVHYLAFGAYYAEGLMVALHRQRPGYDPRLSLVAERGGEVVGHILYSPRAFRVLGDDVTGVNLSPLGVHPLYQGQGIGGALTEAGDSEARRLGYPFSILLGHKDYYPRFGYRQNAYGFSGLTLPASALGSASSALLETRKPLPEDTDALMQLWQAEEGGIDLAIRPDAENLAWHSPDTRVTCTVYLRGGQVVGYTRTASHEPGNVRTFLAADSAAARRMVFEMAQDTEITLPLHPSSGSMSAFAEYGQPDCPANPHCMAKTLAPSPFDEYYDLVQRGERPCGRIIWPAEFDI